MNYKETMEFIEKTNAYGSVLGLTVITELMKRCGNPQDKLNAIHFAGTNGKGSTLSFISSVLIETGEKVGQYTSPVVYQYLEKIKINDKMISKRAFASYVTKIKAVCEKMVADGFSHPTTYEIETAVAFCYFKRQKCNVILIETGLGGAKDATNVIHQKKVCVFTSISMDHMQFLGNTIEKIAKEKAGIITENSIVVVGVNEESVHSVIRKEVKNKKAILFEVDEKQLHISSQSLEKQIFSYQKMKDIAIQMKGSYQIENAALALEVLHILKEGSINLKYAMNDRCLRNGLYRTNWRGRFSVLSYDPLFIVDGAHNEQASKKLRESMEIYFTKQKKIYIMGVLKDKEYDKIILNMVPIASHIITVTTPNDNRALPAYHLAQEIQKINPMVTVSDSLEEAVEMAYLLADRDTVIVAFGSLSYLGRLTDIVNQKDTIRMDAHGKKIK